jgi:hypothetical protein
VRQSRGIQRVDDMGWANDVSKTTPDDVAWMKDLVVR